MKVILPSALLTYSILKRLKPRISTLLHQYSPHYSSLPAERQQQIISYFVSLINAVVMTSLSTMQIRKPQNRDSSSSTLSRQMLSLELIYFADDLFSNVNILTVADMIHHVCALLGILTTISAYRRNEKVQFVFQKYFPRIMVAEASTIFLDLAFILKGLQMNGTMGQFVQKFCQLMFAALFLVIRVCYLPYVVYQMMREGTIQKIGGRTGVVLSCTVVLLQLYWFVKIVHRFRREFLGAAQGGKGRKLKSRM